MKYSSNKFEDTACDMLPSFLILLEYRTVMDSVEASVMDAGDFLQIIESFLFLLINIADPKTMLLGNFNVKEYLLRRRELLTALGLKEYLAETSLIPPGHITRSPLVGPN